MKILYYFQTVISTFAKLKLSCCNLTILKKMDALRQNHDEMQQNAKQQIEESYKDGKFGPSSHPGFSIPFDNIDVTIGRRHMTIAHQNQDCHWVNHIYVQNRVSGNYLPASGCSQDIDKLDNIDILVSSQDEKKQKFEYGILVSRFLVEHFKQFEFLKKVCILHITHRYTKEMGTKSVKVCPLGQVK